MLRVVLQSVLRVLRRRLLWRRRVPLELLWWLVVLLVLPSLPVFVMQLLPRRMLRGRRLLLRSIVASPNIFWERRLVMEGVRGCLKAFARCKLQRSRTALLPGQSLRRIRRCTLLLRWRRPLLLQRLPLLMRCRRWVELGHCRHWQTLTHSCLWWEGLLRVWHR